VSQYSYSIRKGGNCDVLQLEAANIVPVLLYFNLDARNEPAYNNSARDISAVYEYLSIFWPNLYCNQKQTKGRIYSRTAGGYH